MKYFVFVFLFVSFNSCSARLKCCDEVNDVKKLLNGSWKEVNSNSESLDRYSFSENKGYYEEIIPIQGGAYSTINDHTNFTIITKNKRFKIKFVNLLETWISSIEYLDKDKLILKTDRKEKEYYRFEE